MPLAHLEGNVIRDTIYALCPITYAIKKRHSGGFIFGGNTGTPSALRACGAFVWRSLYFVCKRQLIVEPATFIAIANRGSEPIIKPAQGRLNYWLGRTDSNHDKENQNLLSYH